jgi:type II secretory pathway component PulM
MIERIKHLSQREQILVGGAALFIIALMIYFFFVTPALERSRLLGRLIAQKERECKELLLLREEYGILKASEDEIIRQLSAEAGQISPLSHLEQLAQKAGLREQIQQMKPLAPLSTPRYVVTPVQLRFKGTGLQKLIAYLYELEHASVPFQIKRLKIRPTARSAGSLDVTLEVLTFSIAGGK